MQVNSDWCFIGTADYLEQELVGFTFRGPGVYIHPDEFMLVVPVDHEEHPWACLMRTDRLWEAYCYSGQYEQWILRGGDIPIREDTR